MSVYNCSETLVEALDSIMNQTYQDFKVVLCDDCSSDDTYNVAEAYIKNFPDRFVLIRNSENLKLAASLNRCLEYADTEYVARMDGDDISLPTRFEKEIKFLDNHPEYALVSCPMIYFDENGDYRTGKAEKEPTKETFSRCVPFCHAPVLMRTKVLNSIGNYTAESKVERIEDFYLWYKFYKSGYKGYNLQEPLYKMRNSRDAFSRRKASDRLRAYKIEVEVKRGLELPWPRLSSLRSLSKVLIPMPVALFISTKILPKLRK